MKRFGNLYESIISIENLYKAELKARKGKKKSKEIVNYIDKLDENILELNKELENNIYKTSEYFHFTIYEPKYCLKLDIRKFYPSINNEIVKNLLKTKFKDIKLLNLLDNIIDSHIGLPLGSYTSQ